METDRWPHFACLAEEELLRRCRIQPGRAGGPGGQHRNKVETEITLTHEPTGIIARAGERRSQSENRRVAIFRLRLLLAVHVRASAPAESGAHGARGPWRSALWRSRMGVSRGEPGRLACNPEHLDFPSLLAEALDALALAGWEPRPASDRLGISSSQLVRLIRAHPPALVMTNRERAARAMHPLR